jgi:hypothetical protein
MLELYSFVDYFTIPPSFVSIYLDRTWIGNIQIYMQTGTEELLYILLKVGYNVTHLFVQIFLSVLHVCNILTQ